MLIIITLVFLVGLPAVPVLCARPLDQVEHLVIFMQENRAFDHYYGTLKGVRGFNDRTAHPLTSGHNSFYQPVNQSDLSLYQLPWHVSSLSTSGTCMDAPEMVQLVVLLLLLGLFFCVHGLGLSGLWM